MSGPAVKLGRIWARLCDETHGWNAEADRQIDLPPFGITITEDEGDFPVLDIAAENFGVSIDELVGGMSRILISIDRLDSQGARVDTVLLFDGVLNDSGEVEFGSDDIVLRYEAIRANWEALRDTLLTGVVLPIADPCAGDLSDPVERLDGTPTLVCWSRTNRMPVLSNAVVGGGGVNRDIDTRAHEGSVRVRRRGKPLGRVDVYISGEWTEKRIGEFDVGAMIEEAAGQAGLSTLTPEVLGNAWKEDGDDFGGGYVASESAIEIIDAPEGASTEFVTEQAATASRTFRPGAQQPQQVRLRRTWLKPSLKLAATSQVKRREEIRFSVFNAGQGASTDVERLEIRLDNLTADPNAADWQKNTRYGQGAIVCFAGFVWRSLEPHDSTDSLWVDRSYRDDLGRVRYRWELVFADRSPLGSPMSASFLNTPRGYLTIDHGIAVAGKMIAYSQRNWEIQFECDPMEMLDISCRDTVRIVAPGIIPGEGSEAIGKVRSYSLRFAAGEAVLSVTLAVSSGSGKAGGTGTRTVAWHANPVFRLAYAPPVYTAPFAPGLGVAKVEILNAADGQIAHLQRASAEGRAIAEALDEVKTGIRVTTLPTGGGETTYVMLIAVTPYQGYRGISTRS